MDLFMSFPGIVKQPANMTKAYYQWKKSLERFWQTMGVDPAGDPNISRVQRPALTANLSLDQIKQMFRDEGLDEELRELELAESKAMDDLFIALPSRKDLKEGRFQQIHALKAGEYGPAEKPLDPRASGIAASL
eukprot:3329651-Prorocentrum_lima.AAC.1